MSIEWAAGLFEGEGCVHARPRATPKGIRHYGSLVLRMTDEDVVQRFASIVGAGQTHKQATRQDHHKAIYEWRCDLRPDVLRVIDLLLPHMGTRRTAKLIEVRDLVLATQRGELTPNKE
jgi:hypothetical protein